MAFFGTRWKRHAHSPYFPRKRVDLRQENEQFPIYAIGDIHGRLDLLLEGEVRILRDANMSSIAPLVLYLGDYVDRGPDSAGVLAHLTRTTSVLRRVPLCGNHDEMFLAALEGRADPGMWLKFGGRETLASYGVGQGENFGTLGLSALMRSAAEAVPAHHLAFMRQLPILARYRDYVFVHAGVRPGVPIAAQIDHDLLWIREPFLELGPQLPLTVVHGHTIFEQPDFGDGRIGIDTGAYSSGRLTVIKLEGDKVTLI